MQSITVQSHVGEDGILRLQIPVAVKDADLEVTVTLNSPTMDEIEAIAQSNGWPPGFFRQTAGAWQGEPPVRPPLQSPDANSGWPPGYLEQVIGSWQGEFPDIENEGDYEVREELL